jgi:hypothetical protein
MMPITLLSLLLMLFGEVTPPINCVFRRMHDSFVCQTLHIATSIAQKEGLQCTNKASTRVASTRRPATYRCR